MNDKRIHAMIAIKLAEWARRVVWAFMGAFGRRRRFVGAFAGASPPHPDFIFFP